MAIRTRVPQLVVRPHDPRRARIMLTGMAVIWIVSLIAAWQLGSDHAAPGFGLLRGDIAELRDTLLATQRDLSDARDKLALVERSEQVSGTANESLQQTLREREDEIAGLRADLAFFQRLVGGRAQRQSLAVHSFALRPIGTSGGYTYRLTLTQNLRKAAVSEGSVELALEGVRGKQITTVPLAQLGAAAIKSLPFSFKYFQRLEGSLVLPDGFTPDRVKLVVKSTGGERDERAIAWSEALANGENNDVWQ